MPLRFMTERAAAPIRPPADLYAAVSDLANRSDDLKTPELVLDAVHSVSTLEAHNRTHAPCEALRRQLIP